MKLLNVRTRGIRAGACPEGVSGIQYWRSNTKIFRCNIGQLQGALQKERSTGCVVGVYTKTLRIRSVASINCGATGVSGSLRDVRVREDRFGRKVVIDLSHLSSIQRVYKGAAYLMQQSCQ